MMARVPDFFIIGAPKCGTTALTEYLRTHPNICFSRVKEPHFFADDFPMRRIDRSLSEYLERNFSHFDPQQHQAIGEGSVFYYVSDMAVANILALNPAAKFIYMVRNPIDMAYSLHAQYCFTNFDDVGSFETAWELQEKRAKGENIPRYCHEPRLLQYRLLAGLGRHLERLRSQVPDRQLRAVVFDDFVADTARVYEEMLDFIGVPSDGRRTFPVVNENRVQRSRLLGYLAASIPQQAAIPHAVHAAARRIKAALGIAQFPLDILSRINAKPIERPPLSESFRCRLVAEFEPDVRLLGRQLNRDLTHWLSWQRSHPARGSGTVGPAAALEKGTKAVHFLHIGKTGGNALKEALASALTSHNIAFHQHATGLADIPVGEPVIFFVRHPLSRFVSGFNSRLRQGRPKLNSRWSADEKVAFRKFPSPNLLAEALASTDAKVQASAQQAMNSIAHVNRHLTHYLGLREYVESRRQDILFVGFQETLAEDFERLKKALGLPESLALPSDEVVAHRTPTGFEAELSDKGKQAILQWYADDVALYDWLWDKRQSMQGTHRQAAVAPPA
jgi:hypothetical protein